MDEAVYIKQNGERVFLRDIRKDIRDFAPETKGQHIFVQLKAIGRWDEFQSGTTPCLLPGTFMSE